MTTHGGRPLGRFPRSRLRDNNDLGMVNILTQHVALRTPELLESALPTAPLGIESALVGGMEVLERSAKLTLLRRSR